MIFGGLFAPIYERRDTGTGRDRAGHLSGVVPVERDGTGHTPLGVSRCPHGQWQNKD
ncbi:MAG: hypothetical protein ACXW00_07700 [Methylobacter sp.]